MLERIWTRVSRRISGNLQPHSSTARRRPVRLHAERLEERLLMAAVDPVSANTLVDTPTTTIVSEQAPIVAASTAAPATSSATLPSADATDPGWEQFGSKAAFEAWLIEAATAQYGHLFGQKHRGWQPWMHYADFDIGVVAINAGRSSDDYSSTNVQVAGVDEADLIETDGDFLYIISGEDLVIVQAGVGNDLQVMSRIHIGGRPVGMFLSGNRLAIVSDETPTYDGGIGLPWLVSWDAMYVHEATPPKTTVTILDIANRAAPSLVQKTEMDGQLIASRVVDGELRLVLNNQFRLPLPNSSPVSGQNPLNGEINPNELRAVADIDYIGIGASWPNWSDGVYVYETQDEYVARMRDTMLDSFLPQLRNLDLSGEVISDEPMVDVAKLYRPDSVYHHSITTIATFDLDSNRRGPVATAGIMTSGAVQVHATTDGIYLFSQKPYDPDATEHIPKTRVWKFDMLGGRNGIRLAAKGTFEGFLLNQFAADERDGFLRVVTEPHWSQSGHALHVLQQVGRQLEVVGSIDGIASGERLYSVRFLEERAFFVTFLQIDPLFAVDLSDPTDPRLMGELHIPGYSDYLQPIDDAHLLAIGRGANESNGWFEELQVSIFDVSDLANPRLVHRYSFEGGRSTETPATGNRWTRGDGDHHAVSYFAEARILAFPIFNADTWSVETGTVLPAEGGLQVFKIDIETGFLPLGIVEHDTLVDRSLRIGTQLFAISSGTVTVHELDDPTVQLGQVSIAAGPDALMTELIDHPWRSMQSLPLELQALPLALQALQLEAAIGELPLEPPKSQPVSGQATNSNSTPPASWALPTLTQSKYAQRTLLFKSTDVSFQPQIDTELMNLLAAHNASLESSRVREVFEVFEASKLLDSLNQGADELDSLLSDSALENADNPT